ncbi:TATA box-binding protein-associated factor RNA polymerase I subunit C [Gonapodya sp. JEL0774]|nr:TATA box-binding protein-associated factor RNA polymerase I subunit C [Gonapodya sp. JEL0774]
MLRKVTPATRFHWDEGNQPRKNIDISASVNYFESVHLSSFVPRNILRNLLENTNSKESSPEPRITEVGNCLELFDMDDGDSMTTWILSRGGEAYGDLYMNLVLSPSENHPPLLPHVVNGPVASCRVPINQVTGSNCNFLRPSGVNLVALRHPSQISILRPKLHRKSFAAASKKGLSDHFGALDSHPIPSPIRVDVVTTLDFSKSVLDAKWNPFLSHELAFLDNHGRVGLWNAHEEGRLHSNASFTKPYEDPWAFMEWAGHPRLLNAASRVKVSTLDLRAPEGRSALLYSITSIGEHHQITAMCQSRKESFHTFVATSGALSIVDRRMPTHPILTWNHTKAHGSAPTMVKSLENTQGGGELLIAWSPNCRDIMHFSTTQGNIQAGGSPGIFPVFREAQRFHSYPRVYGTSRLIDSGHMEKPTLHGVDAQLCSAGHDGRVNLRLWQLADDGAVWFGTTGRMKDDAFHKTNEDAESFWPSLQFAIQKSERKRYIQSLKEEKDHRFLRSLDTQDFSRPFKYLTKSLDNRATLWDHDRDSRLSDHLNKDSLAATILRGDSPNLHTLFELFSDPKITYDLSTGLVSRIGPPQLNAKNLHGLLHQLLDDARKDHERDILALSLTGMAVDMEALEAAQDLWQKKAESLVDGVEKRLATFAHPLTTTMEPSDEKSTSLVRQQALREIAKDWGAAHIVLRNGSFKHSASDGDPPNSLRTAFSLQAHPLIPAAARLKDLWDNPTTNYPPPPTMEFPGGSRRKKADRSATSGGEEMGAGGSSAPGDAGAVPHLFTDVFPTTQPSTSSPHERIPIIIATTSQDTGSSSVPVIKVDPTPSSSQRQTQGNPRKPAISSQHRLSQGAPSSKRRRAGF